jgi:serine/threonine-protein phosphatase 2A regulatory subunit B
VLQADKSAFKAKKIGGGRGGQAKGQAGQGGKKNEMQTEGIDFAKKIVSSTQTTLLMVSCTEAGTQRRTRLL